MQFQLLILSSLACLASSSIVDTRRWPQSVREYYDATIQERVASPGILSASCTAAASDATSMPTTTASPLPPPSEGLSVYQVVVGRGTQNYSCASTTNTSAVPGQIGAVANLYDTNCQAILSPTTLHLAPRVAALYPRTASTDPVFPLGQTSNLIGHHYFTDPTTPTFNLDTSISSMGIAFLKKNATSPAPADSGLGLDGSKAVPWLKLVVESAPAASENIVSENTGDIKEVYRVSTAGGAAPLTCAGREGTTFQMEYSAEYWFYH